MRVWSGVRLESLVTKPANFFTSVPSPPDFRGSRDENEREAAVARQLMASLLSDTDCITALTKGILRRIFGSSPFRNWNKTSGLCFPACIRAWWTGNQEVFPESVGGVACKDGHGARIPFFKYGWQNELLYILHTKVPKTHGRRQYPGDISLSPKAS